jgi:hypothetical protein
MPSDALPNEKSIDNPWLAYFINARWDEVIVAQVIVKRTAGGFELRHTSDKTADLGDLKAIRPTHARKIANFTKDGRYRPLKSAPDLPRGWLVRANSPDELEEALNHFYPNALADRYALNQTPPITGYREFTARQTGMYRITTFLSDNEVSAVIDNVCTADCLKQRLWTVGEYPTDKPNEKSAIPCLEPCAILLESARKEVRDRQKSERTAPESSD